MITIHFFLLYFVYLIKCLKQTSIFFMNIEELKIQLKRHFGFTDFKGLQREVITNILKNDSFVIMPTGVVNHYAINFQH